MADPQQGIPRRHWLLRTLQGSVTLTFAAILYPVARYLRPRATAVSGALEAVAPFRVNEILTAPNNPFNFGGKPCLVIITPDGSKRLAGGQRLQQGDVKAFNAICPHLQCTVKFRNQEEDILCNCHNGIFDLNGQNVSGPPPRPLQSYNVTLRGEPGQEEIIISPEG